MVIECHMFLSDSVILAWHELDECINRKSNKPLPFLEWHLLRCLCLSIETDRHCVIGMGPLSEIDLRKAGRPKANSDYIFK